MATYEDKPVDPPKKKARSDKDILEEARKRLKQCVDDYSDERKKQKDDLLFSTLEQWPSSIRAEREGDPNGPRPCLTIDQINQYIVQVVNDMRQNRPSVKARPVDEHADVDTAEVFQGIIRQIEDQSVAQVAYATAGECAVRIGEGYFRIVTEYEDEKSFNQVIKVKRIPDPFSVYLGHHLMPDGSDADYGFVFEDKLLENFKREWPDAEYDFADFDELEKNYWQEEGKIRVAEYFYYENDVEELVFLDTGETMLQKDYDKLDSPPEITDKRQTIIKNIKWCKLTGLEILEKRDWAGKYIPIVKVIGKEAWIDGKRSSWGLVRPAKDSLRMYNYWASTITEKIGLSPKTPFIGAKGQFEGVEDRWANANRVNYAYLEYNPTEIAGNQVPPPQRQVSAPLETAMIQQMQIIREDVQASLGMFKASLGKEQPNQSGKAILALTRESDTGTFHFSDNLAISIMHGGRIMIDLIPKIYDTKRVVKILGEDGKIQQANINPELPGAKLETRDERGGIRNIYNLQVGTYDVTVSVGPSYNTKRMEAATMFTDLANTAKDPISGTVMRYLAIKNSDIPGSENATEMMEKLLPPGMIKQEGQPEIPPQVAMQMQQMQMKMQELTQENTELKADTAPKMEKVRVEDQANKLKIAADADAADKKIKADFAARMAELDQEEQLNQREAAIEKAKTDDEIERKWAIANADHEIARKKAADEIMIKDKQCEHDMEMEKRKMSMQEDEKELPSISKNIETGFSKAMESLAKILDENMKLNREVLQAMKAPKHITLTKNSQGQPTGADVRTLN